MHLSIGNTTSLFIDGWQIFRGDFFGLRLGHVTFISYFLRYLSDFSSCANSFPLLLEMLRDRSYEKYIHISQSSL